MAHQAVEKGALSRECVAFMTLCLYNYVAILANVVVRLPDPCYIVLVQFVCTCTCSSFYVYPVPTRTWLRCKRYKYIRVLRVVYCYYSLNIVLWLRRRAIMLSYMPCTTGSSCTVICPLYLYVVPGTSTVPQIFVCCVQRTPHAYYRSYPVPRYIPGYLQ